MTTCDQVLTALKGGLPKDDAGEYVDVAHVRHPDDAEDNYDPDCPYCLRSQPHTDAEHYAALGRSRSS